MCRSSRILGFLLCCALALPAAAQGRGGVRAVPRIGMSAVPRFHAPTAGHGSLRAPMRGARFARGPFGRGFFGRGHRAGYGAGLGVLGFDGAGFGVATAGTFPVPESDLPPPVVAAEIPPPCAPPLIIAIGHGLRHVARTRVIYGTPVRVCGR